MFLCQYYYTYTDKDLVYWSNGNETDYISKLFIISVSFPLITTGSTFFISQLRILWEHNPDPENKTRIQIRYNIYMMRLVVYKVIPDASYTSNNPRSSGLFLAFLHPLPLPYPEGMGCGTERSEGGADQTERGEDKGSEGVSKGHPNHHLNSNKIYLRE